MVWIGLDLGASPCLRLPVPAQALLLLLLCRLPRGSATPDPDCGCLPPLVPSGSSFAQVGPKSAAKPDAALMDGGIAARRLISGRVRAARGTVRTAASAPHATAPRRRDRVYSPVRRDLAASKAVGSAGENHVTKRAPLYS